MSLGNKPLAKMRTEKASTASDEDTFEF